MMLAADKKLILLTLAAAATSVALFLFPQPAHAALTDGLVGWWTFDGADVTDKVYDRSGQANDGYFVSGATSSAKIIGRLGQALSFSSANYVNVGSGIDFRSGLKFSISAWIKGPTSQISGAGLVTKGTGGGGEQFAIDVSSNNYRFFCRDSGGTATGLVTTSTQLDGSWQFITGVFDASTNLMKLYLNGVEIGSDPTPCLTLVDTSNHIVSIGARQSGSGAYDFGFNGSIDDVHIYNRALSVAEISQLYLKGQTLQKPVNNLGLVGYWSLDDATGTIATDFSNSGNTGYLSGFSFPATAASGWTYGRRGNALQFDGTDDYFYTTTQLSNPQEFTLAAWFKTTSASGHKIVGYENTQSGTTGSSYDRHLYIGTDGKLYFGWFPGSVTVVASANRVDDGKWHLVVGTHTGSTGTLFLDGVAQGNNSGIAQSYTGYWRVGNYKLSTWTNASDGYFTGTIDDVRIYSRALSTSSVQALYAGGTAGAVHGNMSSAALQSGSTLANGLIGLWTFDGKDVTTAAVYDRSGSNNNGYVVGASTSSLQTIGVLGQGFRFDGVSTYVGSFASVLSSAGSSRSVCLWFRTNVSSDIRQELIGTRPIAAGANGWAINIGQGNAANTLSYYHTGVGGTISATTPILTNTWYHTCVTYDAVGTVASVYKDGRFLTSSALANDAGSASNGTIGTAGCAAGTCYFSGQMDDVRIYNRVLSASEVKQLYNLGRATIKQ